MRTLRPFGWLSLPSARRALAAGSLIALAAALSACGGDGVDGRTVASDRTADSPEARRELPPPTPDYRAEAVRVDTGRRDPAPASRESAAGGPALPDSAVTYTRAASVYRAGDHRDALRRFEAYVERNPERAWGRYMLALSARKADRPERAVEAFRRVLERDPDHARSRINLARTLLDLDRPEEALATLRPVLRGERPPADALRVAGNAAWETGSTGRAARLYRAAVAIDGSDAWSMNNLGLLLIRSGRHEEALGPLARALELRPGLAVVRNNLGVALERTGHPGLAAAHYRAAAGSGHEKARTSLARVEGRGDPGDGLDLPALAHDFAVEAESWSTSLTLGPSDDTGDDGGSSRAGDPGASTGDDPAGAGSGGSDPGPGGGPDG